MAFVRSSLADEGGARDEGESGGALDFFIAIDCKKAARERHRAWSERAIPLRPSDITQKLQVVKEIPLKGKEV